MTFFYTKRFLRSLRTLPDTEQERVKRALLLFEECPFHPTLRNHRLKGKQQSIRSIAAGYDLRILYREEGNHSVVFLLQTGRHDQVY